MKILMIATNYNAPVGGGGQKSLKVLTEALVEAGHSVSVAALAHDKPGLKLVNGVRVHYLPVRNIYRPVDDRRPPAVARLAWHCLDSFNPFTARDVKAICREEKPDIVHTHVISGLSVSVWSAANSLNLPVVHTLRDQYLLCPRSTMFKNGHNCTAQRWYCKALRLRHRSIANNLKGVIGVSKFILDRHLEYGYFQDVPIRQVIRNTRNAYELGVDQTPQSIAPHRPVRFGFIGSILETKGIEYLLETFSHQKDQGVELWIAGDGKPDYEQSLKNRYQSPKIRFLGRVTQRDFYPQVDVVIVPSLWNDTLPGVVFEALAFGKPVIGAKRGGIPEMIRDGENGLLFEPDQVGDLTAAMERLAKDTDLRNRMSKTARISARPFLDRDAWVTSHIEVYEKASGSSSSCLSR